MRVLYVGNPSNFTDQIFLDPEISVDITKDEIDALCRLKEDASFDVICAEYILPIRNGLRFLTNLKSKKKFKHIPCILLHSEYDPSLVQQAFKKGIEDYYPLEIQCFDSIIDRIKSLGTSCYPVMQTKTHESRTPCKIPISKRLFDIVAAGSLLFILSPLLLITMLAIRLESKGKIYYTAKRVGRRTFDFYKFRSMKVGADKLLQELAQKNNQYTKDKSLSKKEQVTSCKACSELPEGSYCSTLIYDGEKEICEQLFLVNKMKEEKENSSFIKIVDDPRITKVGKFIRNTSIDELPQLINVIKGDMSLVGNRPLPIYEAETLTKDQLSKRFLAPAGITGLWQVELRGKGGEMSEGERIELDNKYADYFTNNQYSFWFDMKILLRTIPALLQQSTV